MKADFSRRCTCAALACLCNPALLSRPASATVGDLEAKAKWHGTKSGLLFFDKPIFFGTSGFDDLPCRGPCLEKTWALDPDAIDVSPAPAVREDGALVRIEYRVRRGSLSGEIVALSDGIGNGGSVAFYVGDGTVNAAVDELVRTLGNGVVRRAIVPASFDLDRGTRPEYPRPEPPGTTFLELALRKPGASGPLGVCPGGDELYNKVDTCLCGT